MNANIKIGEALTNSPPDRCPKCGNEQCQSDGNVESDEKYLIIKFDCPQCGNAWREYYAFLFIENL